MADRVLLLGAQLGHRPSVPRTGVVGNEDRVVAESTAPARLLDQRPLAAALERRLLALRVDESDHADVGGPPVAAARRDLTQELVEILLVARARSGIASGVDPRAPPERGDCDAGVVGDDRLPGRRGGGACLDQRVGLERVGGLGWQHDAVRQRAQIERQDLRQLAQLVLVAGGEDQAEAASSCASRRRAMPAPASSSSSSSEARESGVRSAVAWTSTSPPSPVMTTLASTSAPTSSE